MERVTRFRARFFIGILVAILLFFAFKLYDMQIIQTGGSKDNTSTFTTRTRVKAGRGDLLDTNGNVLVGNRASYNLVINHYVLTSASGPNQRLYELVKLCQKLGIEYVDHLPITVCGWAVIFCSYMLVGKKQTLFDITTNILNGIGSVLDEVKPDVVLVHGDTTTTFAGSLAAYYHQVPVGHVEAGLRTYDKYSPFPEEINRVLTGHIA